LLGLDEALKTSKKDSEERLYLESKGLELGIKTIVFAGMCLEAAIYDYASIQLSDKFVKEHFEKLDLLSKWIIIPRFVCGKQLRKDKAPYAALKQLVKDRNSLVHHKSQKYITNEQWFLDKLEEANIEFEKSIHNAFRALVLLSLEMDYVVGIEFNPLNSLNALSFSSRQRPDNLLSIIDDCKKVFERSKEKQ
jgi:hypothetical protein